MPTKMLGEMHNSMRRRQYFIQAGHACRDRVKRHIRFHDMQSGDDFRHNAYPRAAGKNSMVRRLADCTEASLQLVRWAQLKPWPAS